MKCKYKKRDTQYGVAFDILALVVSTESSLPYVMLSNSTPKCYAQLWNKYNAKEWNPFLFLVAQYLT
jgi:hypothetical protein